MAADLRGNAMKRQDDIDRSPVDPSIAIKLPNLCPDTSQVCFHFTFASNSKGGGVIFSNQFASRLKESLILASYSDGT